MLPGFSVDCVVVEEIYTLLIAATLQIFSLDPLLHDRGVIMTLILYKFLVNEVILLAEILHIL